MEVFGSTITGGQLNSILASSADSDVVGGYMNTIDASTTTGKSVIAGGGYNTISAPAGYGTIAGGQSGTAGHFAFVGGGSANSATGTGSMVVGGYSNTASGHNSFAAGDNAKAIHDGAFVWADYTSGDFQSALANEFAVRAGGGMRLVVSGSNDLFRVFDGSTEVFTILDGGSVGIGTTSPGTKLDVSGPIATALSSKTSAYTITSSDSVILADTTSGAFSITLPTAASITGRQYTIKKTDSSANAVTVATTGSETIDGASTYSLSTQWKYVSVVSDGTNWVVVANN